MAKTRFPGIYTRTLRDGSTAYDVTVSVAGKQRQMRNAGRTLDEAKAVKAQLETEMRGGQIGNAPARLTLGDYLTKRWLPSKELNLGSQESIRNYTYAVRRAESYIGSIRLAQLTALDLEDFKVQLRRAHLSGTSANLIFGVVKQALKQAVRWGLISRNPADMTDAPRKNPREFEMPPAGMIIRLIEIADATPHGDLVYIAIATGMRWSELRALRWADVDFAGSKLLIPRSKTSRGIRPVALGPASVERLQKHRLEQLRFFRENGGKPSAFVFLTETGANLNQGNFNVRWWQKIRRDAGLPMLRFHDLRHIQTTMLARAGVHPAVMQERLGHATSKTTLEVYSHVNASDQVSAAGAVEGMLVNERR